MSRDDSLDEEKEEVATESAEGETAVEREPTTETGLESNVAAALSYLLGPITGVLFYVLEEDDEFVRFHAAQSTILFGGLFALSVVLSTVAAILIAIPILGWLFSIVFGLVGALLTPLGAILWLYLMYKAYSGAEYELPLVGEYARRYASPNR